MPRLLWNISMTNDWAPQKNSIAKVRRFCCEVNHPINTFFFEIFKRDIFEIKICFLLGKWKGSYTFYEIMEKWFSTLKKALSDYFRMWVLQPSKKSIFLKESPSSAQVKQITFEVMNLITFFWEVLLKKNFCKVIRSVVLLYSREFSWGIKKVAGEKHGDIWEIKINAQFL